MKAVPSPPVGIALYSTNPAAGHLPCEPDEIPLALIDLDHAKPPSVVSQPTVHGHLEVKNRGA